MRLLWRYSRRPQFDVSSRDLDAISGDFLGKIDPRMIDDAVHADRLGPRDIRGQVVDEQALARLAFGPADAFAEELRVRFAHADRVRKNLMMEVSENVRELFLKLGGVQGIGVAAEDDPAAAAQTRNQI